MYEETLSFSRRFTWGACRKKYDFQYTQRLRTPPSDMPFKKWQQFTRGTLTHACLESAFRGESFAVGLDRAQQRLERDGLDPEKRRALPDMIAAASTVAQTVADWLPVSDWAPVNYQGQPAIEAKLTTALPGWSGGFVGYADLIATHKPSGLTFIIDWKTREKFDSEDVGHYDFQLAAYQHCATIAGIKIDGTALVEIKPDPPKRKPKFNRNDTKNFYSVRESSDGRIRFTPTLRSPELVATLWKDFEREALSIAKHSRNPDEIYRSTSSFNCTGCKYRQVCFAEALGADAEHVKAAQFVVDIT
jgi:hypothetical protein